MKYRAEIDGLRALAVLPVIFFHAGYEWFHGGFVGVDVFFVISGYLITTIILTEKRNGTFCLINFYERRARRILPALFVVIAASVPCAWLWLLPSDMKDFSESLVAVSVFSSNILFWQESGYWGTNNALKPLLHTWSLAVEEQYYVLFPLLLLLLWRFDKRWLIGTFVVIATLSLLAAQWGAYHNPVANFFLLPSRAWELAIGAGIAVYCQQPRQAKRNARPLRIVDEVLGYVGLSMLGYAIFAFDKMTPFPGFHALVPTLGTGLIIVFASSQTTLGKLLSARMLVAIGLCSYSAYLWHQPLLSFARHRSLTEPDALVIGALVVATFPLAWLSYAFVEKPFRNRQRVHRKAVFTFSAAGSLAIAIVGMAGIATDGFGERLATNRSTLASIEKKLEVNHGLSERCEQPLTVSRECRTSDDPQILLWGDSYAMHLLQGIVASNPGVKIVQMTKNFCGPFFGVAPLSAGYTKQWGEECLHFTQKVHEWLKANDTVKYAVLSSPFSQYLSSGARLLRRNGEVEDSSFELAVTEFARTLNELQALGISPIVFSPPPAPKSGTNIGRCLARSESTGRDLSRCDFRQSEQSAGKKNVYRFLERIKRDHRVVMLSDFLCDGTWCRSHLASTYVYRDPGHLSREGSAVLGKEHDFFTMITATGHSPARSPAPPIPGQAPSQ